MRLVLRETSRQFGLSGPEEEALAGLESGFALFSIAERDFTQWRYLRIASGDCSVRKPPPIAGS